MIPTITTAVIAAISRIIRKIDPKLRCFTGFRRRLFPCGGRFPAVAVDCFRCIHDMQDAAVHTASAPVGVFHPDILRLVACMAGHAHSDWVYCSAILAAFDSWFPSFRYLPKMCKSRYAIMRPRASRAWHMVNRRCLPQVCEKD